MQISANLDLQPTTTMAPSVLNESPENGVTEATTLKSSSATSAHQSIDVIHITTLAISAIPTDTVCRFQLSLTSTALGTVDIPIFALRSKEPGPVVGVTCAVHGNEVNGIPVVQRLFRDMTTEASNGHGASHLSDSEPFRIERGTVIGIPVVNVPGFLASIRCFDEDSKQDLNRLMPGYGSHSHPFI